jgi:hypothetical protein
VRVVKIQSENLLMTGWVPAYILANISVAQSIENDFYALVSAQDSRVLLLRSKYKEFDSLLSKFSNEFGVKIQPDFGTRGVGSRYFQH